MPKIHLKYAGLIAFATHIVSIFTGFLFVIMVTRRLPVYEFGLWVWISRVIGYFAFPALIISYWVTRYVARDFKVAKTSLFLTIILALISTIFYLIISPLAAQAVNAPLIFFLIATIQVPLTYFVYNLNSIADGVRPQATSYGSLIFEITKVLIAALMVVFFRLSLIGAILAIAFAQICQALIVYTLIRSEIVGTFDKSSAKLWLKASWIPLYGGFANLSLSLDAIIIIALSGSTVTLAYFGASYTVAQLVTSSIYLAYALYPKLLAGGVGKDVEEALKLVMMFTIPMGIGAFIISRAILYVLNPKYVVAVPIAQVLIIYALLCVISYLSNYIILGTEKVELNSESTIKDFVNSKLFTLPTITLAQNITYLILLSITTYYSTLFKMEEVEMVFYWACTLLISSIPFVFYKWILARRALKFTVPIKNILKYLCASLPMVGIVQLLKFQITYIPSIFQFAVNIVILVGSGTIAYFITLYFIDSDFRSLIALIISKLKSLFVVSKQ